MRNNGVGIVILNYRNYQLTLECADSFLMQSGVEKQIVIVDNGSPNESYDILLEHYKDNPYVNVISLKNNHMGGNLRACKL